MEDRKILNEQELEQVAGGARSSKDSFTTRRNEFSEVTGYKINIQNSVLFLHINNKHIKIKIKTTMPFIIMPLRPDDT